MAGGMDLGTTSKGGKKSLDAALNLVPFIDLMAVTIVFLIMTAVWTQLGRLSVTNAGSHSNEAPPDVATPPVTVLVTEKSLVVSIGGLPSEPIALVRDAKGRVDVATLTARLAELKRELPDRASLTLQSEDGVHYDDLVRLLDTCIGAGFPAVSISPAG